MAILCLRGGLCDKSPSLVSHTRRDCVRISFFRAAERGAKKLDMLMPSELRVLRIDQARGERKIVKHNGGGHGDAIWGG